MRSEPCELWATSEEVEACCTAAQGPSDIGWALRAATNIVWKLSGRQFGVCETTVRPCQQCGCPSHLIGGRGPTGPSGWPLKTEADCGTCCQCAGACDLPSLHLPSLPNQIIEILIDGITLDPAAYRLYNADLLRVDGGTWPCTQNLASPVGAPDAFSIRYTYGHPVPEEGRLAARILACELLKADCGDPTCQLSDRVQQITRQEETLAFVDPVDSFDQGRTGIRTVDLFLMTVNPNGLRRRARVYDPQRLARFRG